MCGMFRQWNIIYRTANEWAREARLSMTSLHNAPDRKLNQNSKKQSDKIKVKIMVSSRGWWRSPIFSKYTGYNFVIYFLLKSSVDLIKRVYICLHVNKNLSFLFQNSLGCTCIVTTEQNSPSCNTQKKKTAPTKYILSVSYCKLDCSWFSCLSPKQ